MSIKDGLHSISRRTWAAIAAGAAVLAAVIAAAIYFDLQQFYLGLMDSVSRLGWLAPVIFVLLYIIAAILFIPGSPLTLGAGALFGFSKALIIAQIGSTAAAVCAFLLARYVARDWVARRIQRNPKFRAMDKAVGGEGWKIVLLTRLSPAFPFNPLNYALGLTRVRFRTYLWATFLGIIPGELVFVYIGTLAGNLARLGEEVSDRTVWEWGLYGIGFLATVAVTVVITRLARSALSARMS
jgi:uncharacterized membrane protein YdjX (TVP38/TMEM64 family)